VIITCNRHVSVTKKNTFSRFTPSGHLIYRFMTDNRRNCVQCKPQHISELLNVKTLMFYRKNRQLTDCSLNTDHQWQKTGLSKFLLKLLTTI